MDKFQFTSSHRCDPHVISYLFMPTEEKVSVILVSGLEKAFVTFKTALINPKAIRSSIVAILIPANNFIMGNGSSITGLSNQNHSDIMKN